MFLRKTHCSVDDAKAESSLAYAVSIELVVRDGRACWCMLVAGFVME